MTQTVGRKVGSFGLMVLIAVLVLGADSIWRVPVAIGAESLSSRLVYQMAKQELMLSEVRSHEDARARLTKCGLVAGQGDWKHEDADGQVLVQVNLGLRVYIVGFTPSSDRPVPSEILGSLSRAARRVRLDGPDLMLFEFEGNPFSQAMRNRVTATEDVAIRIRDGGWDHSKTTIQFQP